MLEGSYIMDSMVFQAYFNIYYGIIVGTTWYRGGFFADDIVSEWSVAQAQAIYASLIHSKTQKEIAADLNTSPQNISKRIIAGKEYLIRPYLDRCKQIITAKIQTDGIK